MYVNGVKVRKSISLVARRGNPEIDKDIHGRPVESNYVAFVRRKDCGIIEEDGVKYLDSSKAPCIPVGYGGTYYGYGKEIIRNDGITINGVYYKKYKKIQFYTHESWKVYVGSIYLGVEAD